MTAYVVFVRDRIIDQAEFDTYSAAAPATAVGHNATPRAFYGAVDTLEGPPVDGAVIIEFPSIAEARDWYDSPAYQAALKHRKLGAEYRVFIAEGLG